VERYAYARNNPLMRFDPDGKVDRRTDSERLMTENTRVLISSYMAATAFTPRTPYEFGFSVIQRCSDGALSTTPVLSAREPDRVDLFISKGGSDKETVAAFHTHVPGGQIYRRQDGSPFTPKDSSVPSPEDVQVAAAQRIRSDIIVPSLKALFRVDSLHQTSVPVLTEKDFEDWLKRAEKAKEVEDAKEKDSCK
jgi:hypothetical protein